MPIGPESQRRPRGRAAVMDSVLDAATELFAERGPKAATVRAIAERAGVNHALVHRYFGTKQDLVGAVLARETERFAVLASTDSDPDAVLRLAYRRLAERRVYVRFLARAILDGLHPERLQPQFPTLQGFPDLVAPTLENGEEAGRPVARIEMAAMAAMVLGWRLFEDYLLAGIGLADLPRAEADRQIERMIQACLACGRSSPEAREGDR